MDLEVGIALIQAYIFTVLTCVYLGDAFICMATTSMHTDAYEGAGRSLSFNGGGKEIRRWIQQPQHLLGMGLAAAGFAGAGVGIGYIFGKMIEAVARQPEAEGRVGKYMWIGFALVEAIALYGLVIAFIIMGLRK